MVTLLWTYISLRLVRGSILYHLRICVDSLTRLPRSSTATWLSQCLSCEEGLLTLLFWLAAFLACAGLAVSIETKMELKDH